MSVSELADKILFFMDYSEGPLLTHDFNEICEALPDIERGHIAISILYLCEKGVLSVDGSGVRPSLDYKNNREYSVEYDLRYDPRALLRGEKDKRPKEYSFRESCFNEQKAGYMALLRSGKWLTFDQMRKRKIPGSQGGLLDLKGLGFLEGCSFGGKHYFRAIPGDLSFAVWDKGPSDKAADQ